MKKLLLLGIILTVCAVIVAFVFAQFYPGGMISYWKFEGSGATAFDSVDANDGTIYGATRTTGIVGDALSFDGVDDYVEVADADNLDITNELTIDAWFYNTGTTSMRWQRIVHKNYRKNYEMWIENSARFLHFRIGDGSVTNIATLSSGTTIQSDIWYHVAAVYDGSSMKLYLNGILSNSMTTSITALGVTTDPVIIGNVGTDISSFNHNRPFNGLIDEVAIYDRALTADEIQWHYEYGLIGLGYDVECVPSGMVSWWPGDGNADDIQGDNDGTSLVGGATFESGKVGQAFNLDGTGYVEIPNSPSLMPEQFTLDAWVKPVSLRTTSWDSIISHGASGNDSHMGCCLDSYWLGFYREKPTFHTAHVGVSDDQRLSGPDPVTLNEWHHIAGSFDGTTKKLYLDGNLVASTVIASPIAYEDVQVLIGEDINRNVPAGLKFRGLIDEVEIFNRALPASEIQAIYDAGSTGKCKEVIIKVKIDIKPGSYPNCFNSNAHGVIPVAILGSADFDATMIDPFTVRLDGQLVRVKGKSGNAGSLKNVNNDGYIDLVVQIIDEGAYSVGDSIGIITAETYEGNLIIGKDTICITQD